jgi:deoxyribodipyrimidine photo-lyase
MSTAVVLFTRDLRVHDNPALAAACASAERVVPLFVFDPDLRTSPRRRRFLIESLADLADSLRKRGGDLVVRRGDPVAETIAVARSVGASHVLLAADVSAYAERRHRRLTDEAATHRLRVTRHDGVSVVPPGEVRPTGGGSHYQVFTPYWRVWRERPRRAERPAPRRVTLPDGIDPGALPAADRGAPNATFPGGEAEARRRLRAWLRRADRYADTHDELDADATSRLSPYLHLGCVSPLTVASAAGPAEAFVRQLCWRDFFHQLLAAFPALARRAYRPGAHEDWRHDEDALAAWRAGRTGVPIVDAGMRQLAAEGFMHNRARLITASFLTKRLGVDWRQGARWYARSLLDADLANNNGNWQWVAGTGTDTKPYRRFNPVRQALRFDPDGAYVRRWVPELADVAGPDVHQPWLLPAGLRPRRYEAPLALAEVAIGRT